MGELGADDLWVEFTPRMAAGGNKGATGQSSGLPAARKARPGRTIRPTALLVFQASLGLASLLTGKCRYELCGVRAERVLEAAGSRLHRVAFTTLLPLPSLRMLPRETKATSWWPCSPQADRTGGLQAVRFAVCHQDSRNPGQGAAGAVGSAKKAHFGAAPTGLGKGQRERIRTEREEKWREAGAQTGDPVAPEK